MSGRRRKGLSPSLFPFLAVLVCTLGTLILLLALVAQNASTTAQAQAEAANEKANQAPEVEKEPGLTAAQATALIEEGEFRVEQLVSFRDQQTDDLEQRRTQLTQVESHAAKIREQLKRLNEEVELATSEKDIDPVDHAQLVTLKHRLVQEEKAVNQLRADKSDQIPRVALIPHKGPNGTDRRPIYLECTTLGLRIWPEGSTITSGQLEESVTGANPLDDALRVVRHHVMHQYGDVAPPYPLLVVRPDGIEAYAAARSALRDWDDQFGYELVPAAVKLAYDKPDPRLKRRIDEAIRAATIKQHGLNALARRAGSKGKYSADGRRVYPRLSAASMDRAGRASGFEDHREGFSRQNLHSAQQNAARAYSNHAGASSGADIARKFDGNVKRAVEELRNGQNSYGSLGNYASNPYVGDPREGNQQGAGSSDGQNPNSTRVGNGLGTEIGDFDPDNIAQQESAKNGSAQGDSNNPGDAYTRPKTNRYLVPSLGPDESLGHQYNPHAASEIGLTTPGGSQANPSQDPRGSTSDRNQNPSESQVYIGNPGGYQNQSAASQFDANSQSDARSQSDTQGNPGGAPPQLSSSQTTPPAAQSQSQSRNQSQPQSRSSSQRPPAANQNLSATRELVRRQGADWALPQNLARGGGNSIVRTIRVQCFPDRLVLLGSTRDGSPAEAFGILDRDMNRATIELASAVRDRIARWGASLPGGRWQPRLDVEVMPGAEDRFYQLQRMMAGGGVEVEGRRSQ